MAKTILTCPSRIAGELTEHCTVSGGGGDHDCARPYSHVVDEGVTPHRCACGWNWNVRDGERAEYLRDAAPWPGRNGVEPATVPDAPSSAIQVIHLEAGDLVVFEVDGMLSEGEYRHVRERLLSQFGGDVNAVVMERAHVAAILRRPAKPVVVADEEVTDSV